jgi:hypothetical protein
MTTFPCIYCSREEVPRTREHVLQDAFGATAVLEQEVCGDCNASFSALDKDFVDAVNFFHLGKHMMRRLGLGRATNEEGIEVWTRLRRDGLAEHPPQLYELPSGEWRFLGRRPDDLDVMARELAATDEQVSIESRVSASSEQRPALAILRSAPRKYLVEGTDGARVAELIAKLKESGLRLTREGPDRTTETDGTGPTIRHDTALSLDRLARALAKIALNYVSYRLGVEVALERGFDDVRAFARYGTGNWLDFVTPALLGGLGDTPAAPFLVGEEHVLVLMRGRDGTPAERGGVLVTVGGKFIGTVHLQPKGAQPALPRGTWLVSRCDVAAGTWEDLTMPADALRAFINPGALGLEAEWPVAAMQPGPRRET